MDIAMTIIGEKNACRICQKILTHTRIKNEWSLTTIEGNIILYTHFYCVECGTLRGPLGETSEDEEDS